MRRLHDGGRTGLWILLPLVPLGAIALIVLYCLPGTPGPNMYGPPDGHADPREEQVHLSAGRTAREVVHANERGENVDDGLALLAHQRDVLGVAEFERRLLAVLDEQGAAALRQAVDEAHPRPGLTAGIED